MWHVPDTFISPLLISFFVLGPAQKHQKQIIPQGAEVWLWVGGCQLAQFLSVIYFSALIVRRVLRLSKILFFTFLKEPKAFLSILYRQKAVTWKYGQIIGRSNSYHTHFIGIFNFLMSCGILKSFYFESKIILKLFSSNRECKSV